MKTIFCLFSLLEIVLQNIYATKTEFIYMKRFHLSSIWTNFLLMFDFLLHHFCPLTGPFVTESDSSLHVGFWVTHHSFHRIISNFDSSPTTSIANCDGCYISSIAVLESPKWPMIQKRENSDAKMRGREGKKWNALGLVLISWQLNTILWAYRSWTCAILDCCWVVHWLGWKSHRLSCP